MPTDTLSLTLSALADPTRRAIVARLNEGDATVSEIAEPFKMSLPGVSKHLKVLERAGLIQRSKQAQWRRCHLDPQPLKQLADWVEEYRKTWEERFDRLDAYLAELQGKGAVADAEEQ
jgi:DNA-binding transcriptional ArsR family regulator